jgi:hypothetical protein
MKSSGSGPVRTFIPAVINLVDIPELVRLYRIHTRGLGRIYGFAARPDFIAAIAALVGVLVFGTLPGCSSASACRSCCSSTAPRGRTSPFLVKQERTAHSRTSNGIPRQPPFRA